MSKLLILYGTGEGHTRKIATRMAEKATEQGYEAELVKGNKAAGDFSPEGFDAAIIGTSIHMGLHQISVRKLVKAHQAGFAKIPVAYFCVCLTAASDKSDDIKQVHKYIDEFKLYTGLQPRFTEAFAGALRYPYYNFIKRYMIKLVARKLGLDTDTKKEYEYTNWSAVDSFAERCLTLLNET